MGFIADIFEAIGNIIHAVITGIRDAIVWIGKKIFDFLKGWGKWLVVGVVALALFAPGLMAGILIGIKTIVTTVGQVVWTVGKFVVTKIFTTVKWLSGTFQSFLQAIHFKELMMLNQMAMILSKDYREMMLKVYQQISEFSQQVFGRAEVLQLLLQGSRQLIYASSSAVGYPVDIAEVEWVQYLDETLSKVADNAEKYQNTPEAIFDDIAEWVYKPIGDKYSTINQGFVTFTEGLVNSVGGLTETVFGINEQTQNVVSYLPSPLRGTLQKTLEPIDNRITEFQYDVYEPKMAEIDHVLSQTAKENETNRQRMSSLTDRLINPADYLTELDDLPTEVRVPEKRKIDISLQEPERQEIDQVNTHVKEYQVETDIQFEEIRVPAPITRQPIVLDKEPVDIKKPPVQGRSGWFVGDY